MLVGRAAVEGVEPQSLVPGSGQSLLHVIFSYPEMKKFKNCKLLEMINIERMRPALELANLLALHRSNRLFCRDAQTFGPVPSKQVRTCGHTEEALCLLLRELL